MIKATTADIGQAVVCKFRKADIRGEIIAVGNYFETGDYVTVATRIGEQNFSVAECEWTDLRRARADAKAAPEPIEPEQAIPVPDQLTAAPAAAPAPAKPA